MSVSQGAKTIQYGKDSLFNRWGWDYWKSISKKKKKRPYFPYFTQYTKPNSKLIPGLNVEAKKVSTKCLEESRLPYNLSIPHLGIYPREMNTYVYTKTYIQMFTATWFIIAKTRNSPNVHQMVNESFKMWYIHIVEYC